MKHKTILLYIFGSTLSVVYCTISEPAERRIDRHMDTLSITHLLNKIVTPTHRGYRGPVPAEPTLWDPRWRRGVNEVVHNQ